MKEGRQLTGICLSLLEEFIIGQIIVVCKGADTGALPFTLHNNLSTGCCSYPQGVGVIHRLWKTDAGVLRTTAGTYILPNKKYTLK